MKSTPKLGAYIETGMLFWYNQYWNNVPFLLCGKEPNMAGKGQKRKNKDRIVLRTGEGQRPNGTYDHNKVILVDTGGTSP